MVRILTYLGYTVSYQATNMAYTEDQLGIACDLQGKMLPRKMNGPTPLSASEASLANNVTSKCFVDGSILLFDIRLSIKVA